MSLPGVMKHVRVLEDAGLLSHRKEGRTRWCALRPSRWPPSTTGWRATGTSGRVSSDSLGDYFSR